jgi:hypothetical protein
MSDDELLRGYRPAGPPPELRARILRESDTRARVRMREWLPAVAAAAIIILFSALSYRANADLDMRLAVPDELQPVEQWGVSQ